ncbi:MAG: hypothetical protein QNL04_12935 [SAR324 cluster bacterium]|nr:hypothetical protein [SAR324 cluster bacterium]
MIQLKSKKFRLAFLILILIFALTSCKDTTDDGDVDSESSSSYDAPASHTVSKSGYMHHPNLNSPVGTCDSCHGSDLTGDSAPSCYTCHGQKW